MRKIYCLLSDGPSQLKYYDSGVGTNGTPFEHFFGGALGDGLFQKIQDGYEFLSFVWDPGDDFISLDLAEGPIQLAVLRGRSLSLVSQ